MDTCDHGPGPGQSLVTSINYDHDTHLSTHGLTKVTSVTIRKLITTTRNWLRISLYTKTWFIVSFATSAREKSGLQKK